jgi:uncharacterized protein YdaU (DUF1376 family)
MRKSGDNLEADRNAAETAPDPNHSNRKAVALAPTDSTRKSPAFRFYPRDFLTSEQQSDMSLRETGAYIRLLCHCWLNGSLPDDIGKLATRAGAPPSLMRKMWPIIQKSFRRREDGRWIHDRLEDEHERQRKFSQSQSTKGKKGGRPKPNESPGLAPVIPNTSVTREYHKPLLANANATPVLRSSYLERGLEETFAFDVAFERLKPAYPVNRVTSGHLTMTAFIDVLSKAPDGPNAAFARMEANLENQKRGHEWRVKGLIPKLQNWLTSGAWEQQHDEAAPVSEQVTAKTSRTMQAAADLMRGES